MATENQYQPEILELTGGLDFITAKPAAGRGSLSDCINVEVGVRKGYERIGGYERMDGNIYNASANYTALFRRAVTSVSAPFTLNEVVYNNDPSYTAADKTLSIYKGTETVAGVIYFKMLLLNYDAFIAINEGTSQLLGSVSGSTAIAGTSTSLAYPDAKAQAAGLNNDFFYPDNRRRTAPNAVTGANGPITGLHWYKEDLYAINDYASYGFINGGVQVFPGDILSFSGGTARVLNVVVSTGTWAATSASGTLVLVPISGTPSGSATVLRGGAVTALSIGAKSTLASTMAGLFRTKKTGGWEEVNMGYSLTFSGGTNNGPPPLYSRGSSSSIVLPVAAASAPGTVLAPTVGGQQWANPNNAKAVDGVFATRTMGTYTDGPQLQPYNFPTAITVPADSTVTGISLKIKAKTDNALPGPNYPYFIVQCFDSTGVIGSVKATTTTTSTLTDFILGGPTDDWSIPSLKTKLNASFGFNIVAKHGGTGSNIYSVDYVELTVYYTASVNTFYFYNKTDDVIAPITSYFVDSGNWPTNDAHGFMQVASITPYGASTRTYITAGDEIRTAPGGGGALLAVVESGGAYAGLPPLSALRANSSRYEMITANFYGNEDWEAIYGVSGAGQAFTYDGYYFRYIFTGISPNNDKPRHVAFNQLSLALGYAAGNVTISVQGNPDNFNGVDGATSHDVGDPVTGLLRMSGTMLGIFCKSSISGLTGTNIDNYSINVLSPNEGAIEYTVVDIGKPVYCSNKGISLFDQTAAYGSFLGNRLSSAVSSWLLPRLQGRITSISKTGQNGSLYGSGKLLFATICRSKNQYLLFFADGVCLVMTLFGAEQQPQFTLRRYDKWTLPATRTNGVKYSYFIPLANTSAIDDEGKERIFMSHYNPTPDRVAGENLYYAYEFEDSWSFDGFPIPCSMTVNENFYGSPFDIDTVDKVRAHGVSYGYSPIKLSMTSDYNDSRAADPVVVDLSLPRVPEKALSDDALPTTNLATYPKTGRSFSIRLFYDRTNTNEVYPPFTVQVLQIQTKTGKGDV